MQEILTHPDFLAAAGWALHFSQPVRAETREGRIEKARPRILQGKGMHDR